MAVFSYKAIETETGKKRTGELTADSAFQVRTALRRMGLQAQSVQVVKSRSKLKDNTSLDSLRERFLRSRRRQSIIEFYENLATLLSSGSAVVPSLDILASSARKSRGKSAMGTMCRQMAETVRGGANLADAMSQQPDWFNSIDVALVRSGQQSGLLEQSLTDLADMHSQSDALKHKLVGVLTYPAILLLAGLGVVIFLVTVPIPQLAAALQDSGKDLPTSTQLLLNVGTTLRDYWWVFILMIPVFITLFIIIFSSRMAALLRLRMPLLGSLVSKTQLASFCSILERLLAGGIPLTEAVQLATPTIRNAALCSVFRSVPRQLADGKSLADPLRASGLFDPVFCRVLEIGVESGELPAMIGTIGRRYAMISRRLIDRFSTLLEPIVIIILATAIGFVVYATIMPMLEMTQSL